MNNLETKATQTNFENCLLESLLQNVSMKKLLFVCLGNICRSPLAEAIFKDIVQNRDDRTEFLIDSAGTSRYHVGQGADPRALKVAQSNGLKITHLSRQLNADDFDKFDLILAMDQYVKSDIEKMMLKFGKQHDSIELMRKYDSFQSHADVKDPYFYDYQDFVECYEILLESCLNLAKSLR
jgi:protein-tyrosine phosphatase